jgi:hypothetical protein
VEGRPDAEHDSLALITIHASKGLECALGLMAQLAVPAGDETGEGISSLELTHTVLRTLVIPEIAVLRARLVP